MSSVTTATGEQESIPLYRLVLRWLALEKESTTLEAYDKFANAYSRGEGHFSRSRVEHVLLNLKRRGEIKREQYDNGRRGPNPYRIWITHSGKKQAVYFWPDLELNKSNGKVVKK
ncbi:hypothetical protein AKJ52_02760 [candidate division MSBL1 archaeon SCGC-AAA382C18]|uniref:Cdc6 C-terminal domain-containing protein n=1 Tax=candidate division MSBL1 archaeon SCGC-AAA382C18 TaxID=1698281 RepID=A0A133VHQ5_9EURY|nr:hypothetical protein AKJ52_02760 [candidate division MSBL1 archaeon SCGC-AAA382C18]